MKNEAHVIGDRVPNERDLVLELKLALLSIEDEEAIGVPALATRFPRPRRFLGFVVRTLRERRNRLALLELSDDQLKDIGLSRCQACGEYSRYRQANPSESAEANSTTSQPEDSPDLSSPMHPFPVWRVFGGQQKEKPDG
ncbi:uncharacterized protein YjiS (DUF1127 family) [Rhizobium herbae]|uniref:Uncharacterized protein YjiS (DUF1127 family) n=1 Tax=Rhizobium herbae TaxID=508661 RepID=A0ABS4ELZ7_9HYPH|nr:uncharacterized protein YjiS (DUF1127 family) [Rhizobium herbae]